MEFKVVKDQDKSSNEKKAQTSVEQPKWTLEEVALSQDTIDRINEMIAYIKNKDKLLNDWQFNRFLKTGNGLSANFFGLPGTGKSITAEGVN